MKINGYSLPLVAPPDEHTGMYPHQAVILDEWDTLNAIMLVTKTGSGKTRAAATPILQRHESALFVYPTNALMADQVRSISNLMEQRAVRFRIVTPENVTQGFTGEEYLLIQIDGSLLDAYCNAFQVRRKGDALKRLLFSDKRRIVLLNPDILFLIFGLQYRNAAESIAQLQAFHTVVFDEFHLYTGVELCHALFMIHLARRLNAFHRILLLSATPDREVAKLLESVLSPRVIDGNVKTLHPIVDTRIVAHDLTFEPVFHRADDEVHTVVSEVMRIREQLYKFQEINRTQNDAGEYLPAIVILNSVVTAIAVEDALVSAGFPRADIVPIRGLTARSSRVVNGKVLAIGTSAIEVGIDFEIDYLIFRADDIGAFLQRLGRLGRHRPGVARFLCDYRVESTIASMGTELSRTEFENEIRKVLPNGDGRAWFCKTWGGIVSVLAQVSNFTSRIESEYGTRNDVKQQLSTWMSSVVEDYANAIAPSHILKSATLSQKNEWFQHYAAIDRFRTSLPSVNVFDLSERQRGRESSYSADVKTLLRRSEGLRFDAKEGRVIVNGYAATHSVYFAHSFEAESHPMSIQTTARHSAKSMEFVQDRHRTPLSNVMHTPNHHIFCVVSADVIPFLDWRVAWFRCGGANGKYVIAFDGDALLLKEIDVRRTKAATG